MKVNGHQQCKRCGGSKFISKIVNESEPVTRPEPCPRCNGEGIEYLVSPEYVRAFEKGEDAFVLQQIRAGNFIEEAEDIEGTPV